MGRMVATPELKSTNSGTHVTSFVMAVERNFVKQGEERQTDFIDCVAWRNTAEFITSYFQKGSMIAITGNLQTRNYEDKDGNKRKKVEVIIERASFCGSKAESNDSGNNSASTVSNAPAQSFTSGTENDFEEIEDDDDLPF